MRRWRALTAGAVVVVVLSGCTASPGVDQEAVQKWFDARDASDDAGVLAMLGALAAPRTEDIDQNAGVKASFPEPTPVGSILFSCFGADTMSVDITMIGVDPSGSQETQAVRTDDLPCDGEPRTIALSNPGATSVTANGLASAGTAAGVGAWSVSVQGS